MDRELVNTVVEQVLAELRKQGVTTRDSAPAPIAPEPRPSPTVATPPPPSQPASPPTPVDSPRPAAKIWITADVLQQRLAANGPGPLTLEHNEYLTPGAKDVIDRRHVTLKKASAPPPVEKLEDKALVELPQRGVGSNDALVANNPAPAATTTAASTGGNPSNANGAIGIVVERTSPTVDGLLRALAHDKLSLTDYTQTDCWIQNLTALGDAIAAGRLTAGVTMLPHAADAMLLAGKMSGIRPVQGTRPDSVAAAIRHYGANLLIVEHAFSTYHEMRQMVRIFATRRSVQNAAQKLLATVRQIEGGP
jgi:hypothetical protein